MAGKRSATSDLNHLNWNTEDEPEDSGTFKKASEDVIKARVIKTARRRNPISSVRSEESKNSIFQAFTGFSKTPTPTSNAFSFLSNLSKSEQPKTNGISEKNESIATYSTANALTLESNKKQETVHAISTPTTVVVDANKKPRTVGIVNDSGPADVESADYYAKLKGLNESVSKWIKQHVDENPLVSLQPIFKDYEKYFEELEKEYKNCKRSKLVPTSQTKTSKETKDDVSSSSGFASFSFKPSDKLPLEKSTDKTKPTWSFGVSSTTETKDAAKLGSLSKDSEKGNNVNSLETPKFTFGTSNSSSSSVKKTEAETPKFTFSTSNSSSSSVNKTETETPKFTFGTMNSSTSPNASKKTETEAPKFSFGLSTTTANSFQAGAPSFSFGTAASSTSTTGFSFPKPSTSMPSFTFTNVSKPESSENKPNEEEEEEPPKNEFTPVVEEGHVYTTKCKVFVKKDQVYGDRGVGNLYLKPIPDSEKKQLIVRADTNLGNLLCNFILSESIPIQRMGKKDVMMVCLPTPDTKPPPVPILLRVKSPEEADKLLETLNKYKK